MLLGKDIQNYFCFSWPFSFVVGLLIFSWPFNFVVLDLVWLSSGSAQNSSPDGALQNSLLLGVSL